MKEYFVLLKKASFYEKKLGVGVFLNLSFFYSKNNF
jgi:hypothetical protein